tara:strand:- start:5452 stop:5637 length:186 start_codon:yes stop_codon:yes gene_type:complete
MQVRLVLLLVSSLLVSTGAVAGIAPPPPMTTAVPIDSPWVISGLVVAVAVIGARLLHNRRK